MPETGEEIYSSFLGVPIMRGLAGLQESAISKSMAKVIKDLRESLDSGRELSAAMRRHPLAPNVRLGLLPERRRGDLPRGAGAPSQLRYGSCRA